MEAVIDKLLASAFGTDLNSKIVGCIKAYREACIEHKKPEMYNEFIRVLKAGVLKVPYFPHTGKGGSYQVCWEGKGIS